MIVGLGKAVRLCSSLIVTTCWVLISVSSLKARWTDWTGGKEAIVQLSLMYEQSKLRQTPSFVRNFPTKDITKFSRTNR